MDKATEKKILSYLEKKTLNKSELHQYTEQIGYMLKLGTSLRNIYGFLQEEYHIKTSYSNFHNFAKKNFNFSKHKKKIES
ncbi:hypothetical protein [uncultured Helicobacter sp.]|uniref:hypothetical protein n=1 Tax=uncultured Helicobacter sp. TaxID=175537 RepID=UPI002604F1F1|nr:hypothetical protein [uncultured Helicobacter sp.]